METSLVNVTFVALVVAFTLVAAWFDMRTMRIPNGVTVSAFVAALVFHAAVGGWQGLGGSLLGFLAGFSVLLVVWLGGAGGAGDAKLMGAIGAWMAWPGILFVLIFSTMIVVTATTFVFLAQLVRHGGGYVWRRYITVAAPRVRHGKSADVARRDQRKRRRIMAFALPVALGTWVWMAWAWHQEKLPFPETVEAPRAAAAEA